MRRRHFITLRGGVAAGRSAEKWGRVGGLAPHIRSRML
jgi:hypothetical protein